MAGPRIEPRTGLSEAELQAIAALERRVVDHDGGRLKLEWRSLRGRAGEWPQDALALDGDRLVGFAGGYGFGAATVEVTGMVDPAWRRRGVGSGLLDAVLGACRTRGHGRALLVVPRGTADGAGERLAQARGGFLEHSEHALVLTGEPARGGGEDEPALRAATRDDVSVITALLTNGFGFVPGDLALRLHEGNARTLVAELEGRTVATLRTDRDGEEGSVYGFAVDARRRGRGIGRAVLVAACRALRAAGAERIRLEVAVDNDAALHLYTSVGFQPVATEDYYELSL